MFNIFCKYGEMIYYPKNQCLHLSIYG